MSDLKLDDFGQPINKRLSFQRLKDRSIDELIGLSRGIIADGNVNVKEAEFLKSWLDTASDFQEEWPFNVLMPRVYEMLEDNILDEEEQKELLGLLTALSGGKPLEGVTETNSTTLPLDNPAPQCIEFDGKVFCITGKCVSGTRSQLQDIITSQGGTFQKSPTSKTDYLIIGELGSSDWMHSSHGRKIESVVKMKEKGNRVSIVSEQYWMQFV